MSQTQDVYGEPTIFKDDKWTIRVYRPILTEEERAKRMKRIHDSFAALYLETMLAKRKKGEI